MPIIIPLETLPSQALRFVYADTRWLLNVRDVNGGQIAVDVQRNGEWLTRGMRAVAFSPLLQYRYHFDGVGNFYFDTMDFALPDYTKFGITQSLLFITPEEVEAASDDPQARLDALGPFVEGAQQGAFEKRYVQFPGEEMPREMIVRKETPFDLTRFNYGEARRVWEGQIFEQR